MTQSAHLARMIRLADDARRKAYAPYSRFQVGACLRSGDRLFAGANVENRAYPQSQCAEASAIGVMVANGRTTIDEVVIVVDAPEPVPPCGACRQRLSEFASPDTPVHLVHPDGRKITHRFGDLLPHAFEQRHFRTTPHF